MRVQNSNVPWHWPSWKIAISVIPLFSSQSHTSHSLPGLRWSCLPYVQLALSQRLTENPGMHPHGPFSASLPSLHDTHRGFEPLLHPKSWSLPPYVRGTTVCSAQTPPLCTITWKLFLEETDDRDSHLMTFHSLRDHSLLSNAWKDFVQGNRCLHGEGWPTASNSTMARM